MSEGISANVADAVAGLDGLDRNLQRKGIRQSLRASCKPTLTLAKSTAPELSGTLKRNTKLRSAGVKQGNYKMVVGVGKKWFTGPTFYAAFVAFGHRIGKRALGDARKEVPANEWLEKAYDSTKESSVEIFKTSIEQFIEDNAK